MKKILITLLITASFSTFADEIINLSGWKDFDFTLSDFCYVQPNVQERQGVLYFPNEEVGITDTSLCFFKDAYGQYESKGKLKDGRKDGKWFHWKENGQKWLEVSWKNGKQDGLWIEWQENGQIKSEENYKDGKSEGKWTWWYENGQKKLEENWTDGIPDGKWTSWFENGLQSGEGNFKNGTGTFLQLHENNQKSYEVIYKDGNRDGNKTAWY